MQARGWSQDLLMAQQQEFPVVPQQCLQEQQEQLFLLLFWAALAEEFMGALTILEIN